MSSAHINYPYANALSNPSHAYLLPTLLSLLRRECSTPMRLFELGCGNGFIASNLAAAGFEVVGIDASPEGILQANKAHPELRLELASAYDDLASRYGRFPVVVSLEVVEHLYEPRKFAKAIYELLEPGGRAIVSTPFHGYWKNLALAASGRLDGHFTALWDHGHIKFWSKATLTTLLAEAGFHDIKFVMAGRFWPLNKSMVAVARK